MAVNISGKKIFLSLFLKIKIICSCKLHWTSSMTTNFF